MDDPDRRPQDRPDRARADVLPPPWRPGCLDAAALDEHVAAWVRSPALAEVIEACGWPFPDGDLDAVVAELLRRSAVWDLRNGRERDQVGGMHDVEVEGRTVPGELVLDASEELGLAAHQRVPTGSFTHVVVLGGLAAACLARTRAAAGLLPASGTPEVVLLSANRPLSDGERADAEAAGMGTLDVEADAAMVALQQVLALGPPTSSEVHDVDPATLSPDQLPDPTLEGPDALAAARVEQARRRSWAHHRWPGVHLAVAPSGAPTERRTRTADQLTFWAERVGLDDGANVLLVTTEHYVPYQHLEAIRVLGRTRCCGITTWGHEWRRDPATRPPFLLMEIRSMLQSIAALRAAPAGTGPGSSA